MRIRLKARIAAALAAAGIALGVSVATATSAAADYSCRQETTILKICMSGFAPTSWNAKTQFIKVVNPYNYDAYFLVYPADNYGTSHKVCIGHGKGRTFDRGTYKVGTKVVAGKLGWGAPAPC